MIPTEPSPIWDSVVSVWNRIDREEGVHDTGRTLEWLLIAGAEELTRLRDLRGIFAAQLVAAHGPDAEVAVALRRDRDPLLYVGGERHGGELLTVEVAEGRREDESRIILRPAADLFPSLVLGSVTEDDLPATISLRVPYVAGLPLLEGPALGFPRRTSPTGGYGDA